MSLNKTKSNVDIEFVNQIIDIIDYYKDCDYTVYEKLIYCLGIYQKEEKYIFGYNDHENGGYVRPPNYFMEFGVFMDSIRPVYDYINPIKYSNIMNKYYISNFGYKHFDWSNLPEILDDIHLNIIS